MGKKHFKLIFAAVIALGVLILFGDVKANPVAPALAFKGYTGSFVGVNPPLPSPMVRFFDAKGARHTLLDHRGKVVLVNFWATWCPPCVMEMPSLNRLQARLGGDDFEVLTISQDRGGSGVVGEFLRKNNLNNLPIFIDRRSILGGAFRQNLLPTSILLDRQGREVGRLVGGAEWDSKEAVALIERYIN